MRSLPPPLEGLCCALLLLLGLCNAADINGTCTQGAVIQHSYGNKDGTWQVTWTINCDTNLFKAVVTAEAGGWVGFGLNTEPKMHGANVIQGQVNATNFNFINARAPGEQQPIPVTPNAYFNASGETNGNQSILTFYRYLDTADANGRTLADTQYLLWAYQSTDPSFSEYHSARGAVAVDLFAGNSNKKTVNYVLIHALMMLGVWGFLAPIGTFSARYLKNIGHTWYRLHTSIQYTVLIGALISFIIIENFIGPGYRNHFQSKHAIIGTVVIALVILQVLLGIISNALFDPNRKTVPLIPDKAHWWLGRSLLVLSLVNIFLGFDLYGLKSTNISPFIIYGVWIGVTLLIALFMDFKVGGQVNHVAPEYTPLNNPSATPSNRVPLLTFFFYCVNAIILYSVCSYEIAKS